MFRFTLATYMLLASLAGPSLCCCTFARLVGQVKAAIWNGGDHQAKPLSCCQGQFEGDLPDNQSDSESPDGVSSQKRPVEHCKCQKVVRNAVPSKDCDNILIGLNRALSDELTSTPTDSRFLEVDGFCRPAVRVDGTSTVCPSGREIRIDIHSWRC